MRGYGVVQRLTSNDGQEPDDTGSLPNSAPPWPVWRGDEPLAGSGGVPYLSATLRMRVASGRSWQCRRLIENAELRTRLRPLLRTLPVSHSCLQEPHGGLPCRFSDKDIEVWQDTNPDRWPNSLYRRFAEEDGPRPGWGDVAITLRLETRAGLVHQLTRTIGECNVRADGALLIAQLSHDELIDPL